MFQIKHQVHILHLYLMMACSHLDLIYCNTSYPVVVQQGNKFQNDCSFPIFFIDNTILQPWE